MSNLANCEKNKTSQIAGLLRVPRMTRELVSSPQVPSTAFNQRFGERLRTLRERAELTQVELANQVGYPDGSQVSRWEHGHAFPSDANREALAAALGITQEGLFQDPTIDRRRTRRRRRKPAEEVK